jgi:hypothetical protein
MDEPSLIEFLVEHYLPGATRRDLRAASSRLAEATGERIAAGEPIRYLGSTVVPAEESCFSRFESGSEDLVRRVLDTAQVAYARIHVAEVVHPTTDGSPKEEGQCPSSA